MNAIPRLRALPILTLLFLAVTSHAASDQFVAIAAQGSLTQVALGELALQREAGENIDAFARKMIDEHKKLNDELDTSAAAADADVPRAISKAQQGRIAELSQLDGEEFDARFADVAVSELAALLSAFRKESESGEDARVKSFAEKSLPVLEQALAEANALRSTTMVEAGLLRTD